MINLTKTIIPAAALAFFGVFGTSAQAASVSCLSTDAFRFAIDDLAGTGGTNDGCEVGSVNNDNPLPGQVNTDTMFTFNDWLYAGKLDANPGDDEAGTVNIGFSLSSPRNVFSGSWSVISTLFDTYTDLMIVAKGGNSPANGPNDPGRDSTGTVPINYVGYLFTTGGTAATSGGYVSPFSKDGSTQGISHWTAYVRGTAAPKCPDGSVPDPITGCDGNTSVVPLPAGLPLMLTVIGVGAYMRRRVRKSA